MEELCMKNKMQNAEVKNVIEERTGGRSIRRPRWKEYTLIKYVDKKAVSKENIWVDESKLFPSDNSSAWEMQESKINKKVA